MADLFESGGYLDWATSAPLDVLTGSGAGYPNSGGVASTTVPLVTTGGTTWGDWFDRIVGAYVTVRKGGGADAQITTYPGAGGTMAAVGKAGQPAVALSAALPWLMVAGVALAGFLIVRKL